MPVLMDGAQELSKTDIPFCLTWLPVTQVILKERQTGMSVLRRRTMAELKTKVTKESVQGFLKKIPDEQRRKDCQVVLKLMEEVTGAKAVMWGPSIVGFGRYRYKYESGREAEWMVTGFSPRKNDLTLYIMPGFEQVPDLMKRLGKHKTGKSCLYLKKLEDVDLKVLKKLVSQSVKRLADKRVDK